MVATKSIRSKYWFVRIDGSKQFLRQKCEELSQQIDTVAMLSAYHVGDKKDNPHCHFVIELASEPQKQSFAVRLKGLFAIEKKTQYALDVWDGNRGAGACSYLFHEEFSQEGSGIICNKGFTDEELADARAANDAVQRVVKVNKEKASTKFVERALKEFENDPYVSSRDLLEFMMTECRDGNLYWPGTFRARQMIEEVQVKLCPKESFQNLVSAFHEKMFR